MDLTTALTAAAVVGTSIGACIVYVRKELFPIKKELQSKDEKGQPHSNGHTMREGQDDLHTKVDRALEILEGQNKDLEKLDIRLLLTERRVANMFDEQNEKIDNFCTRLERMENVPPCKLHTEEGGGGQGS